MLVISDGKDWTKNTPRVEFPFIKSIYMLYDKADLTENAHFGDEGHDYGKNKRIAAYNFLSRHLAMDISKISNNLGQVDESFVTIVDRKTLEYFKPGETKNFIKGDQVYHAFKSPGKK